MKCFWKRWSTDIVLMKEDNVTPTQWPLGRVTQVYRGDDNYVRVVNLKTVRGEFKRPVNKVVLLLPLSSDCDTQGYFNGY